MLHIVLRRRGVIHDDFPQKRVKLWDKLLFVFIEVCLIIKTPLSLFEGLGSSSRAIRAGPSKAILQIPGK